MNFIFNKGYNAFFETQGMASNPYCIISQTKNYRLWALGFNIAESKYRQSVSQLETVSTFS